MDDQNNVPKPFIIATFLHGQATGRRRQISECRQTKSRICGRRRPTFSMKIAGSKTEYVGDGLPEDQKDAYEWIAAVRNRETGETVFAPVDLVAFRPKIEKMDSGIITKIDTTNYAELRRDVDLQFGSKRKKQQISSSLRTAVNEDGSGQLFSHAMTYMATNDDLKKSKQDAETSFEGESPDKRKQLSTALPPCNTQAKSPSEVYDVNDIVGPDLIELMTPEAQKFLALKSVELRDQGYPMIVIALAQNALAKTAENAKIIRACHLLYLAYLIKFHNAVGRGRRFIVSTLETFIPSGILRLMTQNFTSVGATQTRGGFKSAGTYAVTAIHKDMILSRVAVLLLLISGQYAFSFGRVLQDLGAEQGNVTAQKLITVCRALGCRVEKNAQTGEQICILEGPPKAKNALLGKRAFGAARSSR